MVTPSNQLKLSPSCVSFSQHFCLNYTLSELLMAKSKIFDKKSKSFNKLSHFSTKFTILINVSECSTNRDTFPFRVFELSIELIIKFHFWIGCAVIMVIRISKNFETIIKYVILAFLWFVLFEKLTQYHKIRESAVDGLWKSIDLIILGQFCGWYFVQYDSHFWMNHVHMPYYQNN